MSDKLTVRHLDGDRFAIDIRGHTITVDQPSEAGGGDTAPTPTELFIAALASCIAPSTRGVTWPDMTCPTTGLAVLASYTIGGRQTRVTEISVRITPPEGLPDERRDAFSRSPPTAPCTTHWPSRRPSRSPSTRGRRHRRGHPARLLRVPAQQQRTVGFASRIFALRRSNSRRDGVGAS